MVVLGSVPLQSGATYDVQVSMDNGGTWLPAGTLVPPPGMNGFPIALQMPGAVAFRLFQK